MDCTTPFLLDKAKILRAMELLVNRSADVMLQALPSPRRWSLGGGNRDVLYAAVEKLADLDPTGIYVTLNPVKCGVARCAANCDIIRRRWLLIDIDRDKTFGPKE